MTLVGSMGIKRAASIAALGLVVVLAGCASRQTTGSVPQNLRKPVAEMNQTELKQATNYWQKQYERRPKDKKVGLQFATALLMTGRNEQALAVMQQVAIHHPTDRQVLGAYGKALAGAGNLKKALETIQRAQTPDNQTGNCIRRKARFTIRSASQSLPASAIEKHSICGPVNPASSPISACPICWRVIFGHPKPISNRPSTGRAQTAACGRIWLW